LGLHGDHLADCLLLGLVRHQLAVVAQPVAERYRAAEIPAASLLVGLHLSDALSNAISLGLSEGCGDRQEQLADPVARDVAAQVEQVQLDAPAFQALNDLERI
jgi:hypothetical protein